MESIARQLLTSLPQQFALAGLSMGGIVALEMLRQAPERIERLALLDTNASAEQPQRQAKRVNEIALAHSGRLRELMIEEMKPHYLADDSREDQALLDLIVAMATDLGPHVFERQSLALRDRPDAVGLLASIDCPTLIICGEQDQLCPVAYHQLIHEQIRGSELHIIERCGHLSTLEQPHRVSNLMRSWLHY